MPSNVSKEKHREYNQSYYKRHGEELKEKRRLQYKTDPNYKAMVRMHAKKFAIKKKLEKEAELKKAGKPLPKRGGALRAQNFKIAIGEKFAVVKMYPVRHLASQLKRKAQTIRNWEVKKIIPKAMYRSPGGLNGNRLYTDFQVEKIIGIYNLAIRVNGIQQVNTRISKTVFPELVKKLWEDYPLGVDPLTIELEE